MGVPSIRVSSVRRLDIHEFLIAPDEPGRAVLIPLVATGSVEEGEAALVTADHKVHRDPKSPVVLLEIRSSLPTVPVGNTEVLDPRSQSPRNQHQYLLGGGRFAGGVISAA